jgi:hypothetical protein
MKLIAMQFLGEVSNPGPTPSSVEISYDSRHYQAPSYTFVLAFTTAMGTLMFGLSSADTLTFCQAMGGLCDTPAIIPPPMTLAELDPGSGQPLSTVAITIQPSNENGTSAYDFTLAVNRQMISTNHLAFRIFGSDIYDAFQGLLMLHNNWA